VGTSAPSFDLAAVDLGNISSADFAGKNVVLNIFPSVDTATCATTVRTFNERAADLDNTAVLCVSADLPFAQGRFCGAEGIANVKTASTFKSSFGADYGVSLIDGKFKGLLARAVVVVGQDGSVKHTELVSEIAQEPNYDAALSAL
jgi:thiol peroxidase